MPDWYRSSLPEHRTWHGSPSSAMFWRSAVIAESRKSDQSAFAGRNLMRLFQALHTQFGVGLDLIMVLVDVPRERVLLAAFPSFLGVTTGSGLPMPTAEQMVAMRRGEPVPSSEVAVVGADENERKEAASAEQRIAAENSTRALGIVGPDDEKWSVYIQEFSARPSELLEEDGHTLTIDGAQRVERFVRGVVMAAREWVPVEVESARGVVEVNIQRASPLTGPSLRESLGNGMPTSQPATRSTSQPATKSASQPATRSTSQPATKSGRCYVATAVYGSYDCPQVWALRRFRDGSLAKSRVGRAFIRTYYRTSPYLIRHAQPAVIAISRRPLDALVRHLTRHGIADGPYRDRS